MKLDIYNILIQEKLVALAHEAQEAYSIITKAYTNAFSIGQTRINCFSNPFSYSHRSAEISIDGKFIYDRSIEIPLTENGIFTCLVAELAVKEQLEADNRYWRNNPNASDERPTVFDFGLTDDEKLFADAAPCLRDVIEDCKEVLKAKEVDPEEEIVL